ncbi:MAG: hypothetical protein Q7R80_00640 [bacterium]|nr:hypothetical protein [bacterium]
MKKGHGCTHLCLGVGSLAGVLGLLSIVAAWVATWKGAFWGLGAGHWYEDAKALLLLGIFCFVFVQVGVMHGWNCAKCGPGKCCGDEKCEGCGADCEHCKAEK